MVSKKRLMYAYEAIRFSGGLGTWLFIRSVVRNTSRDMSKFKKFAYMLGGGVTAFAISYSLDTAVNIWEKIAGIRDENFMLNQELIEDMMK